MKDTHLFAPDRDGADVRLFLEAREEDGDQPIRRLYWLLPVPSHGGWSAIFPAVTVDAWLELAVSSDFEHHEGESKAGWRLSTRYLPARFRHDPPALGVDASLLNTVSPRWERV
jgi:hypothetical protein